MWFRIYRHALLSVGFLMGWVYGLLLSGPFRTTFLSCHYDFTLASIITGIFVCKLHIDEGPCLTYVQFLIGWFYLYKTAKSGPRLRGSVLFLFGVIVLLVFGDGSGAVSSSSHHRPTRSTELLEEQYFLSKNSVRGINSLFRYIYDFRHLSKQS
jgi:hypothetical protein